MVIKHLGPLNCSVIGLFVLYSGHHSTTDYSAIKHILTIWLPDVSSNQMPNPSDYIFLYGMVKTCPFKCLVLRWLVYNHLKAGQVFKCSDQLCDFYHLNTGIVKVKFSGGSSFIFSLYLNTAQVCYFDESVSSGKSISQSVLCWCAEHLISEPIQNPNVLLFDVWIWDSLVIEWSGP